MNTHKRYPQELKERAVKMVLDHSAEYPSEWQALGSTADRRDDRLFRLLMVPHGHA